MSRAAAEIRQNTACLGGGSPYLMIRYHNHALRKVELHTTTFRGKNFSRYCLITTDADRCRTPNLCHQNGRNGEESLGH